MQTVRSRGDECCDVRSAVSHRHQFIVFFQPSSSGSTWRILGAVRFLSRPSHSVRWISCRIKIYQLLHSKRGVCRSCRHQFVTGEDIRSLSGSPCSVFRPSIASLNADWFRRVTRFHRFTPGARRSRHTVYYQRVSRTVPAFQPVSELPRVVPWSRTSSHN